MYADLLPAEVEAWHLKCLGGQKMPSLEPLHPARGGDRVTLTLKPTPRKFYKAPDLDKSAQFGLSTGSARALRHAALQVVFATISGQPNTGSGPTTAQRVVVAPHPTGAPPAKAPPVQPPPPHTQHQQDPAPNRSSGQELPKSAKRSRKRGTGSASRRVTLGAHSRLYLAAA